MEENPWPVPTTAHAVLSQKVSSRREPRGLCETAIT